MTVAALIVAAGKGDRAGGAVPKQFARLGGKAMLAHSIDAFLAHPKIGIICLVIGEGQKALATEALGDRKVSAIVTGGAERHDSVRAGLAALAGLSVTQVLIHDAARPFLSSEMIDRLIGALDKADGAIPALPVVDTLARGLDTLGDTINRSGLIRIQTPQAFRYDAIMTSHTVWNGGIATDDAQMARAAGYEVAIVEGDPVLEKITHAEDFLAADRRIRAVRTGMGFDVHRLERGKDLWLCGLKLDHDFGLAGHSDAEVALHAVVDAVLGAIGDGDIGSHFPPSDAKWKGAQSSVFVDHARALVESRGGTIEHVDLTIICEAPKIGPYRDEMRARLAALLEIDIDKTSVKATTTEGLGLTGRREGIAAQAIATVRI
ncbi:MAG: bifunctional 2-C-methyl-D-erythritol 4-phosphate cytidylyltransferase/2-C-methyl-D-erythritol 2,4-cyclodiphosphate synthase [Sphingomonadales bacterium]|nr:bifunctional 2-C-methyl-D-erythritol 4-phosphate cytidylyltransferase/2-C-methyl-D-erythritol 2,4-cyclodiphosphate synthase [Sphingomonadales bacterium]